MSDEFFNPVFQPLSPSGYEDYTASVTILCNCGNRLWFDNEGEAVRLCPDCGRVYRVEFAVRAAFADEPQSGPFATPPSAE